MKLNLTGVTLKRIKGNYNEWERGKERGRHRKIWIIKIDEKGVGSERPKSEK